MLLNRETGDALLGTSNKHSNFVWIIESTDFEKKFQLDKLTVKSCEIINFIST